MNRSGIKNSCHAFTSAAIVPAALGLGLALPPTLAHAIVQPEEIIVTARRSEEVIQDVPISMTVFSQDMLDERNVISATDLVKYTPSLNVNTRFGSDQASFAIRGFTQEFRTTASVTVYFADVVAPRGGAIITAGDGAGPGAFFDLQNVQVLKGPQGTLFGRNTTGGAIQLVPQEPSNEFEGYLELSSGNYDMQRVQGVVNTPVTDRLRVRLGVDQLKRDGYIDNVSNVGPGKLSDVDYMAGRASVIADITDDVQNYTILTYSHSENNGTIQGLFACDPGAALSMFCQPTLDSQKGNFYAVASGDEARPISELKQWQFINTTTWSVSESLTIKNILSYADLEQNMRSSVFGTNFTLPAFFDGFAPGLSGTHISFYTSGQWPGMPTSSQTTFVEELQFSGYALDDLLTWQAGLYYENSRPDGDSGTLSTSFLVCQQPLGVDKGSWQCMDPFFSGFVQSSIAQIEYTNMAAYTQGTYDISDELRLTMGLRYTVDKTDGSNSQIIYGDFPNFVRGAPATSTCVISSAVTPDCDQRLDDTSEAPTWLIGLDYLPSADLLLYAKYARGYRQGSLNMFAPEGLQKFEPEKVDAYEFGSKWTFHAPLPVTLNVALFYNELQDQQLQVGYLGSGGASTTTAIQNAGASTIQGAELETTLQLHEGLMFSLSYTHLDTEIDEINEPSIAPGSPYVDVVGLPGPGSDLTFSPRHTVVAALDYRLPLRAEIGDISIGANYTYIDEQVSIEGTYGTLDARELVNLNASWRGIMGSSFDLALFATNVTDEEYASNVTGFYDQLGMDFRVTGEPKMYGARLKYSF